MIPMCISERQMPAALKIGLCCADPCDASCQAAFSVIQNNDYFGNSLPGTPITNPISADECQYACWIRDDCR